MTVWGKNKFHFHPSCHKRGVTASAIVAALMIGAVPAYSAEYMPPPLFAGPADLSTTPAKPVIPVAPAESITPITPLVPPENLPEPVISAPDTIPQQKTPEPESEKVRVTEKPRVIQKPLPPPMPVHNTKSKDLDLVPTPPPGVKGDIPRPPNVLSPSEQSMVPPGSPVILERRSEHPIAPLTEIPNRAITPALSPDDLLKHPARTIDPPISSILPSSPSTAADTPNLKSSPLQKTTPPILPPAPRRQKPAGLAQPILDGPGLRPLPVENQKQAPNLNPISSEKIQKSGDSIKESQSLESAPPKNVPQEPPPQERILKPTPIISKKPIKSPSPTIKRIVEQNPRVMIYSRDKETGEFRAVKESEHRVLFNKGTKTTLKTAKGNELPPPDFIDDVMDNTKLSPPARLKPTHPPAPPASLDDLSKALDGHLSPISEDDLNRAVLTMTPQPFGSKSPEIKPIHTLPNPTPQYLPETKGIKIPVPSENTPKLLPSTENDPQKIIFERGLTDLSQTQRSQIDDEALSPLAHDLTRHIEIRSYASPLNNEQNSDRRVALARGLAVRDYLKSQGITSERIELKVLGAPIDLTPPDRVDLVIR